MSEAAIVLIIVSAFIHASWNFHGKRIHPTVGFFVVSTAAGVLILSPIVIYHHELLATIPSRGWTLVLLGGTFHAIYYYGLASAYNLGDMSIAYPLARSLPIVLVTAVTLTFGFGGTISMQALIGFAFVMIGCLLLPMENFRDLRLSNYVNGCCLLAVVAAIGTSGYTVVDDRAMALLRELPGKPFSEITAPANYAVLGGSTGAVLVGIFALCFRRHRGEVREVWASHKCDAALMGLLMYCNYGLVLAAMAFAKNVSYIIAFRQLSIPIGAVLGMILLKEASPAPKRLGIATLLLGLGLVAAG